MIETSWKTSTELKNSQGFLEIWIARPFSSCTQRRADLKTPPQSSLQAFATRYGPDADRLGVRRI